MNRFARGRIHTVLCFFCAGLMLFLTGCASFESYRSHSKKESPRVKKDLQTAETVNQQSDGESLKEKENWTDRSGKHFLFDPEEDRVNLRKELPEGMDGPIIFNVKQDVSFIDLIDRLSRETGINIRMSSNLMENLSSGSGSEGEAGDPAENQNQAFSGSSTSSTDDPITLSQPIEYEGTTEELFNYISTRTNTHWMYHPEDQYVEFFRTQTRRFTLTSFSGANSRSFSMSQETGGGINAGGGDQQSGQGGGESSMEVSFESVDVNLWQSVLSNIQSMLSDNGEASLVQRKGDLIVRDTPSVLNDVEKYVQSFNEDMDKQIAMRFQLIEVNTNSSQERGLNMDVVVNNLEEDLDASLTLQPFTPLNNNGFRLNIPESSSAKMAGSNSFVKALNEETEASVKIEQMFVTRNREPIPFSQTRTKGYLAESSTSSQPEGGVDRSLTPGSVTDGFTLIATPLIQDDGTIDIELAVENSERQGIDNVSPPGVSDLIQVPEVTSSRTIQRISAQSGDMMILTNFEQESGEETNSESWFYGFESTFSERKTQTIMTILPVRMDNS